MPLFLYSLLILVAAIHGGFLYWGKIGAKIGRTPLLVIDLILSI